MSNKKPTAKAAASKEATARTQRTEKPVTRSATTTQAETQATLSAAEIQSTSQQVPLNPQTLRPHDLLQLQRSVGNRAVQHLVASQKIQAKLTVGAAHDPYEAEAEQVAEQVMRLPAMSTPLQTKQTDQAKPRAALQFHPAQQPTSTPVIRRLINQNFQAWNVAQNAGAAVTKVSLKQYYRTRAAPVMQAVENKASVDAIKRADVRQKDQIFHGALSSGQFMQQALDDLVDAINETLRDAANTELFEGIEEANLTKVRRALQEGANINTTNLEELTPLLVAERSLSGAPPEKQHAADAVLTEVRNRVQGVGAGPVPTHPHALNPVLQSLPVRLVTREDITPIPKEAQSLKDALALIRARVTEYNWRLTQANLGIEAMLARLDLLEGNIEEALKGYGFDLAESTYLRLENTLNDVTTQRTLLNTQMRQALGMPAAIGAGNRADRHQQLETLNPTQAIVGANNQALKNIYARQVEDMGNSPKTHEEAWSAVAAAIQLPLLFSQIEPAREGTNYSDPLSDSHKNNLNVEYYDNQGRPWDQKGAFHGPGQTVLEAMAAVASAIKEQQEFHYPRKAASDQTITEIRDSDLSQPANLLKAQQNFLPVGVLLDVTYINDRQYQALWSKIFQNPHIDLARLREVSVSQIIQSGPGLTLPPADQSGTAANVTKLETWNAPPGSGNIEYETLRKKDGQGKLAKILNGTDDSWHLFRNHQGLLPGNTKYTEHSVPSTILPDTENKARFVFSASQRRLYITGTHYEGWSDGTNNHPAFYEIINLP